MPKLEIRIEGLWVIVREDDKNLTPMSLYDYEGYYNHLVDLDIKRSTS